MAEFCRECFIKTFRPTQDEINRIVMTKEIDLCEGCGEWKPVVSYLRRRTKLDDWKDAWRERKKK